MTKAEVISELSLSFYDCNCTDQGLVMEWIKSGETMPGYANMTDDELVEEWSASGLFETTITKSTVKKDCFIEV